MFLESPTFGWFLGGMIVLLAAATASFETIGLFEDEGIYEATASSLAQGHGYRIESLPGAPPNSKYPFAYPALLAGLDGIFHLPGILRNLVLKLSNVPLLLLLVWVFEQTLRLDLGWPVRASRLASAALGLNASILAFSTIMMTELSFMLAIWMFLRTLLAAVRGNDGTRRWVWIGLWGVVSIYLRTAAVAFLAAGLVFLLLRRRWRPVLVLGTVWVLAALPWILWSRHALDTFQRDEPGLASLLHYHLSYGFHAEPLLQTFHDHRWAAAAGLEIHIVLSNLRNFLESLGDTLLPVSLIYASSFLEPPFFLRLLPFVIGSLALVWCVRGYRATEPPGRILFALAMLFHLLLFIVWPWPFAARFLLPVLPLILVFLGEEFRRWPASWSATRRISIGTYFALQLFMTISIVPGGTVWGRWVSRQPHPYRPAIDWLRSQIGAQDVVFSGYDSQWLNHELGRPSVGFNTLLPSTEVLRLNYGWGNPQSTLVARFAEGIDRWIRETRIRGRRIWIVSDPSLNGASRHALLALERSGCLREVFHLEDFFVVYEPAVSETRGP